MDDSRQPFPIPAPAFDGSSRVVAPGNAFDWLRQGWAIFIVNPGVWIALALVFLVIVLALNIVPLIGQLAAQLLTPVLAAGLLLASRKASDGLNPEIGDLFVGFRTNAGNLVMIGVFYMLAMLVIFAIVMLLGGGSVAGGLMMGRGIGLGLALGGVLLAMLLTLALSLPVLMALWFAPALVFFNGMAPTAALKASFNACLKNTLAFLVYGLIVLVLAFFAALPVMLGFLVLIPVLAGSLYASYRDVFVAN